MNLKQLVAAATMAGAFGAAAMGAGAGLANAAPSAPAGGHSAPAAGGFQAKGPGDPGGPGGPGGPGPGDPDPVELRGTTVARADPVDLRRADPRRWTRWRRRTRRPARRPGWTSGRTRPAGRPWSPGRSSGPGRAWWAMAWGWAAWLLPRGPVGRRTRTLGTGRTTAARLGPAAPAARRAMGWWPDQLLGLPGNALLEHRLQSVGFRLLRSLDPPVIPR